jgi:ubiquinone/menaquinone biosynthesis C-methylase UbiE
MGFYQEHVVPHLINLSMRNAKVVPYRQRVVPRAGGRVLEVGVGSGLNLPLYANATHVIGLEPSPKLLAMAKRNASVAPTSTEFVEGSAEAIPLDDASVDTVVTTWTLCSIPDARRALSEMRRVLKPSGRLLFVEHGRAPDDRVRWWQERLNPIWTPIAGGCRLDRPIANLIGEAGFRIESLQTGYAPGLKPMTFMYEGSARPG